MVRAAGSGTTTGPTETCTSFQKGSNEHFFANWICGDYDMKWLSHEENEDLRRAERAKLSREELKKLGFEEPY